MTQSQLIERRQTLEAELAQARSKEAQYVAAAKEQSALIHTLNGALQENGFWLEEATKNASGEPAPLKPQLLKPNGAVQPATSE